MPILIIITVCTIKVSGRIIHLRKELLSFHDMWDNIDWKDEDQVKRNIATPPSVVSKDLACQNAMKNSDKQNSRIKSERALTDKVFNVLN